MSPLVSCQNISKHYGVRTLFEQLCFAVHQDERIGLIGMNGAGKSTLLRLIYGLEEADEGLISKRSGLKMEMVGQDPVFDESVRVQEHLHQVLGQTPGESSVDAARLITKALAEMGDGSQIIADLSGGYKKRLAILSCMVKEPDLILMDEPTNHLDFRGVLWLEQLLAKSSASYVIVSHDRYFLERTVGQVCEISPLYPHGMISMEGSYTHFMTKKEEYCEGLVSYAQSLDNKMRREQEWLNRGPKARSTKSRSRIQAADVLKKELLDLKTRLRVKSSDISFTDRQRKSKNLVVAEEIALGYDDKVLAKDLNLTIRPARIMGICGANGSGKSTLLRVLAKKVQPLAGQVKHAQDLQVVYFEQFRNDLDPEDSVQSALSDQGDGVRYQGRMVHVVSWAKKFGFDYDQMSLKVKDLSGGERARLAISRLVRREADILFLDEPTNDLDINTLEILEESLLSFPGGVVIISHDRYLMSKLCDEVVGFLPSGMARAYASYEQWEKEFIDLSMPKVQKKSEPKVGKPAPKPPANKKRLSYKDQREFDAMEERIMAAEIQLEKMQEQSEQPEVLADPNRARQAFEDLTAAQAEVERLYARWAELEAATK